jgi:hypothetical protein
VAINKQRMAVKEQLFLIVDLMVLLFFPLFSVAELFVVGRTN